MLQLNAEHQIYLTQYTALFCHEVIEYLNNNGHNVNIEQTSKYSIKDIRMKTKFFDFSIKKLFQCVENVDALQHAEFINQMAFPQLGKWNIHYNLGIFFDDEKRIVGNSHYGYYLFQDEKMISKTKEEMTGVKVLGEEIRDFAYDMGRIIGSISDGLSQISDFIVSDVYTQNIVSHSQDFNTNRCFGKINEHYKIIRLFLLHVLSSIGFLLYVLKKVIIRDSGLLLRLEYISFHYTLQRIEELLKYSEKNNFFDDEKLRIMFNNINLSSVNDYRKSEFRNCMMHFWIEKYGWCTAYSGGGNRSVSSFLRSRRKSILYVL